MVAFGFVLLIIASVLQGSFGLGMKKYNPFSWECFWGLFIFIGGVLIPHIWMGIEVPNYMDYVVATPVNVLIPGILCGFAWGVSALLFGKAIDKVGVSLTYGINMGVSASLGSLIALFLLGDLPETKVLMMLILGSIIMLAGVVVITKAGILKDKQEQHAKQEKTTGNKDNQFVTGLMLAMVAGLGSAAMNIGFVFANQAVDLAVADGISPIRASLISWIIVLAGGAIPQILYPLYVMIKKKTYKDYVKEGASVAYVKVIVTAVVWFAALAVYAKATALLGNLGPVVGWVVFNALALVVSNFWGLKIGEWTGFEQPKKVLMYGNIILLISFICVGIANGMNV